MMQPIPLEGIDAGTTLVCEYFVPAPPDQTRTYRIGALAGADDDRSEYDLQSFLGLAFFDLDDSTGIFTLLPNQIGKFQTMANAVVKSGGRSAEKRKGPGSGPSEDYRASATRAPEQRQYTTTSASRADRAAKRRRDTNTNGPN